MGFKYPYYGDIGQVSALESFIGGQLDSLSCDLWPAKFRYKYFPYHFFLNQPQFGGWWIGFFWVVLPSTLVGGS
jgi:hypothetical protein